VAADPRLAPTDVMVLLALLYWARDKAVCWPSDRSIGLRIGRSVSTVQRSLRRLESLDLVERVKTDANRTGRILRLVWRGPDDRPPRSPVTDPPPSRMTDEGNVALRENHRRGSEVEPLQRQRPRTPAPDPPAPIPAETDAAANLPPSKVDPPVPATIRPAPTIQASAPTPRPSDNPGPTTSAREQALAWLSSGDPILRAEAERRLKPKAPPRPAPATTAELLSRLREDPANVAAAAELLAREFDDRKSWSGFHAVAKRAFEGEIPPEVLVHALARATDGKARNPGALFMTVVAKGRSR
jgi:hypothetical protein